MTPAGRFLWSAKLPAWLLILVAPLALLFLLSLVAAGVVLLGGALLAALVLPRLRRRPGNADSRTIELEPSDFRRLPGTDASRDRD